MNRLMSFRNFQIYLERIDPLDEDFRTNWSLSNKLLSNDRNFRNNKISLKTPDASPFFFETKWNRKNHFHLYAVRQGAQNYKKFIQSLKTRKDHTQPPEEFGLRDFKDLFIHLGYFTTTFHQLSPPKQYISPDKMFVYFDVRDIGKKTNRVTFKQININFDDLIKLIGFS